jgi:MOSC domain-containing protein YiiM
MTGVMTGNGSVAYINRSDGGVPKLHVPTARITVNGLDTDRHADIVHHGGPDRAVCLFSVEHILVLQREGHPIYPGSAGENLTLTGVPWDSMVPGVSLETGDVRLMITSFTTPCRTIRGSFSDHQISRISQKVYPGWSRVYARVLREGMVSVGDRVIFL